MSSDDSNSEGAGLTYSLSGLDSPLFTIDSAGILSFASAPDFEMPADGDLDNVYQARITVTDSNGLSDFQDVEIMVTDVNEAPSVVDEMNLESVTGSTETVTLTLFDPEGDAVTMTVSSDNQTLLPDGNITVSGTGINRALTFNTVFGQFGTAVVSLILSDGNSTVTESFTVTVTNFAPQLSGGTGGIAINGDWQQLGSSIVGEAAGDESGYSVSTSADGLTVAIGAIKATGKSANSGHARVYRFNMTTLQWRRLGADIDGEGAEDQSGISVSLSADGSTLALGANGNDHNGQNAGLTRIYQYNAGTAEWEQLGADIYGPLAGDNAGWSVSLSEDGLIAAISSVLNSANAINSGRTRVYEYDVDSLQWNQLGNSIDGTGSSYQLGASVSLSADGQTLALGANGSNVNAHAAGHAQIHRYNPTSQQWDQLGSNIDGQGEGDNSGWSVSLSSDATTVAIGAFGHNGSGTDTGNVRVFQFDPTLQQWVQLGADIEGEADRDGWGFAVSLSEDGSTLASVARFNDGNGMDSGHTRVYHFNDSSSQWEQLGADIDGEAALDGRWMDVELSSDGLIAAIGASGNGANGLNSGHTRIFRLEGGLAYSIPENTVSVTDIMTEDDIDSEGAGLVYSLSATDASLFSIDSAGMLSFISPPDFETPADGDLDNVYEVTVTVMDSGGLTDSQAVEVTVTDLVENQAPQLTFNGGSGATGLLQQLGTAVDGQAAESMALSADGLTLAVGRLSHQYGNIQQGEAAVYRWNVSSMAWEQKGSTINNEFVDNDAAEFDQPFADTLSLNADGSILAVSDPRNGGNSTFAGHVRIFCFDEDSDDWVQMGLDLDGAEGNDIFGQSISLSADGLTLAIGAPEGVGEANSSAAGYVQVFHWNSNTLDWDQLGADIAGEANGDLFGQSVSLSSDGMSFAVGAPGNAAGGENAGHARVYDFNSTTMSWLQRGADIDGTSVTVVTTSSGGFTTTRVLGDYLGRTVSLSGDGTTFAIGSQRDGGDETAGHVKIYRWNDSLSSWQQAGGDIDGEVASVPSYESTFRLGPVSSVSLDEDGSHVLIGAHVNNYARLFSFNEFTQAWEQRGIDIDGEAAFDQAGALVSLSGNGRTLAVASPANNSGSVNRGHVRVFRFDGIEEYTIPEHTTDVTDVMSGDDSDSEGSGLTYSLGGIDGALFMIDGAGMLAFIMAPDFDVPNDHDLDNRYEISVAVTDSEGLVDTADLIITVIPVLPITVCYISILANGDVQIEIESVPGAIYQVEYSSDLVIWNQVADTLTSSTTQLLWTDDGQETQGHPSTVGIRFYRFIQLAP